MHGIYLLLSSFAPFVAYVGILERDVGFPSLGILLQKLESPALRACLQVPSDEVCFHVLNDPFFPYIPIFVARFDVLL